MLAGRDHKLIEINTLCTRQLANVRQNIRFHQCWIRDMNFEGSEA